MINSGGIRGMNKSFSVVSGKTYHSERDKNI